MELDILWQMAFIFGLVGFGIWFSHLTFKLHDVLNDIGDRGDDIDEIRDAVEVVAKILEQLPQMLPQFHMNQSPLQPLIQMFAEKMKGNMNESLQTALPSQGPDGRYDGTTQSEIKHKAETPI